MLKSNTIYELWFFIHNKKNLPKKKCKNRIRRFVFWCHLLIIYVDAYRLDFYWSQLRFAIRTIKEYFAVHLWNFSLGLNISCHIMQTVNKAWNGFQKCSISFIKIEYWGFTSVEWKFTDTFYWGRGWGRLPSGGRLQNAKF